MLKLPTKFNLKNRNHITRLNTNQEYIDSFFNEFDSLIDSVNKHHEFFNEHNEFYLFEKSNGKLKVQIDVPGVQLSDIEVIVYDGRIEVSALRAGKAIKHIVSIDHDVDDKTLSAELLNGVLTLSAELTSKTDFRKLEVKLGT